MGNKQKPDLTNVNRGLKDFQKNSVDYVFKRLYEDLNTTNRFLIADEVGLGKTLVAKGVIARAINHLWDKVKRLDVIYICSNTDIARQNIRRLKVTDNGFSLASRITLLPSKLKELNENKLNFISFTPGTSFNLRSSTGVYQERALLYWILREAWDFGSIKGPVNLLQCDAYKDNWREHLKKYSRNMIDPELKESFIRAINESDDLKNRFEDLIYRFRHYKENIPREDRWARNKFIGDVREKLAVTCIHALKPDLIILDEFQRFKYLLDKNNPTGQLAHELFGHENENFGVDTKTLLLSATP